MDQATVTLREQATSRRTRQLSVGTAPVNWNNDDLRDWRTHLQFDELLDAMALGGYSGTEFGAGFPRDPSELRAELDSRGLQLCGSYQWFHFQDPLRFSTELDEVAVTLEILARLGSTNLIVASAMTPERIELAGRVPADGSASYDAAGWSALSTGLEAVRDRAGEWGINVHFHNHVGSHVESPAEVERLIESLPQGVDLCFDTGHYAFGGGNPVEFVRQYVDVIGYLHLKDVDPGVLQFSRENNLGFLDALRRFVFCELGEGMAHVPQIISTLAESGYSGWVIVEQDTCPGDPTETAKRNRTYLRDVCGI